MKEIKAIIQPHMLPRVMDALHAVPHFPGATVSDCQGQGRGRGAGGHYEPAEDTIFYAKKVRLEIFCADGICSQLVDVIRKAAHTGRPGDGLIVVIDVERVVRIRTGQEQDQAL
jgi:nitrogen regulatory protein P-II 1